MLKYNSKYNCDIQNVEVQMSLNTSLQKSLQLLFWVDCHRDMMLDRKTSMNTSYNTLITSSTS